MGVVDLLPLSSAAQTGLSWNELVNSGARRTVPIVTAWNTVDRSVSVRHDSLGWSNKSFWCLTLAPKKLCCVVFLESIWIDNNRYRVLVVMGEESWHKHAATKGASVVLLRASQFSWCLHTLSYIYTVVQDLQEEMREAFARRVHKNKIRKARLKLSTYDLCIPDSPGRWCKWWQLANNCSLSTKNFQSDTFKAEQIFFDVQGCPGQLQCGRSLWSCVSGGWVSLHIDMLRVCNLQQTPGMGRHSVQPQSQQKRLEIQMFWLPRVLYFVRLACRSRLMQWWSSSTWLGSRSRVHMCCKTYCIFWNCYVMQLGSCVPFFIEVFAWFS